MPLKKKTQPSQANTKPNNRKTLYKKKVNKKAYAHAKTCTYTYKIMNDHMQKNAHTNAKKCI